VADAWLWKVPLKGGGPILLSRRPAASPAIAPDGRWVATVERERALPRAWVTPVAGGDGRILELPPGAAESPGSFRFSPDGTALDYAQTDGRGVGNVWRVPLEGGPAVQLTHFTSLALAGLDWSHDGLSLVCLRGEWQGDAYLVRGDW